MLARRATTKIIARQQNTSALVARLIEHKIRVRALAGGIEVAPVSEEYRSEASTANRFEKAGRCDLIRVDIGTIKRYNQAS